MGHTARATLATSSLQGPLKWEDLMCTYKILHVGLMWSQFLIGHPYLSQGTWQGLKSRTGTRNACGWWVWLTSPEGSTVHKPKSHAKISLMNHTKLHEDSALTCILREVGLAYVWSWLLVVLWIHWVLVDSRHSYTKDRLWTKCGFGLQHFIVFHSRRRH